jgi:hypothetical protein
MLEKGHHHTSISQPNSLGVVSEMPITTNNYYYSRAKCRDATDLRELFTIVRAVEPLSVEAKLAHRVLNILFEVCPILAPVRALFGGVIFLPLCVSNAAALRESPHTSALTA